MNIDDIILKIKKQRLIRRYLVLIMALFCSACIFNLLVLPSKLVIGGVGGITVITKYLYSFDPALMTLLLSIAFLVIGFMYLGFEKTSSAIIATFIYPFFIAITKNIGLYIDISMDDMLLISVFIGVFTGFLNGIVYKIGFSNGGLPIISQVLFKYKKISIAKTSFIINGIIVVIGGVFFGYTNVMYALIVLFINSLIVDRVILGISSNKAFYIITSEEETVKKYIIEELEHSVTVFDVKGAFLEKKRKVLLTVVPTREYFQVTTGIKLIDENAFFVACDAYQVEGGK